MSFITVTDSRGREYTVKVSDLVPVPKWYTELTDTVHIVINFIKEHTTNQVHDNEDMDYINATGWETYKLGIERIVTTACSIDDY